MTALLAVRGLTKHFPVRHGVTRRQSGAVRAVEGLDLDVAPGETFGLVGESGCGKTTTARLLTRLLVQTSGAASVPMGCTRRSSPRRPA